MRDTARLMTVSVVALLGTTLLAAAQLGSAAAFAESGHRHHHPGDAAGPTPDRGKARHHAAPYSGQQDRRIKALSPDEITALRRGEGMGFAKAAELNGLPGPAHLLELKERIGLSPDQVRRVEAIHAAMRRDAIEAGERLIALEKQLDEGFADNGLDGAALKALLARIAAARARLRFVHLSAHLETPALLTAEQIDRYNRLRGYR